MYERKIGKRKAQQGGETRDTACVLGVCWEWGQIGPAGPAGPDSCLGPFWGVAWGYPDFVVQSMNESISDGWPDLSSPGQPSAADRVALCVGAQQHRTVLHSTGPRVQRTAYWATRTAYGTVLGHAWSTPSSQWAQPPAVHWRGRADEVPLLHLARWSVWCAADAGAQRQLPWLPGTPMGEL